MFKLLLDEPPLVVLPSLAVKLGLGEAIVLQQVHYWLQNAREMQREGNHFDGRWWIYNTYEEWQRTFPFWSERTIQRTILNLEEQGLLLSAQPQKHRLDRRKWYSIDYDAYRQLVEPSPTQDTSESPLQSTTEDPTAIVPTWHARRRQNGMLEDDKVAPSNVPKRHARRRQSGTFFKGTETTEAETTAKTTAADIPARITASPRKPARATSAAAVFNPSEERLELPPQDVLDATVAQLIAEGVNRADALRLANEDLAECQRQLSYLDFVAEFKTSRGAYLRTAIEQGFSAPVGFVTAQKAEQQTSKRQADELRRKGEKEAQEQRENHLRAERERLEREEPQTYAALLARADELLAPPIRARKEGTAYRPALLSKVEELIAKGELETLLTR